MRACALCACACARSASLPAPRRAAVCAAGPQSTHETAAAQKDTRIASATRHCSPPLSLSRSLSRHCFRPGSKGGRVCGAPPPQRAGSGAAGSGAQAALPRRPHCTLFGARVGHPHPTGGTRTRSAVPPSLLSPSVAARALSLPLSLFPLAAAAALSRGSASRCAHPPRRAGRQQRRRRQRRAVVTPAALSPFPSFLSLSLPLSVPLPPPLWTYARPGASGEVGVVGCGVTTWSSVRLALTLRPRRAADIAALDSLSGADSRSLPLRLSGWAPADEQRALGGRQTAVRAAGRRRGGAREKQGSTAARSKGAGRVARVEANGPVGARPASQPAHRLPCLPPPPQSWRGCSTNATATAISRPRKQEGLFPASTTPR